MRAKLEDMGDLRQCKRVKNFKVQQEISLLRKFFSCYDALKTDLNEIKSDTGMYVKIIEKNKNNNSIVKARTREHCEQSLSKLHQEQMLIQEEIEGLQRFDVELLQQLNTLQEKIQRKKASSLPTPHTADESVVGKRFDNFLGQIEFSMKNYQFLLKKLANLHQLEKLQKSKENVQKFLKLSLREYDSKPIKHKMASNMTF